MVIKIGQGGAEMTFKTVIEHLAVLLGGVAVFMLGLKLISENMYGIIEGKAENRFQKIGKSRLACVGLGAGVTAVIQSSTATNIMLLSLTEAGALSLKAALCIMMGANIGTTMTAQLIAVSSAKSFSMVAVCSVIALVGLCLSFSKNKKAAAFGNVFLGFGLIFIGLDIMNKGIYMFGSIPFVEKMLLCNNPALLIINGILITGIVQSSSAVTGVMILLGLNGLITLESSIYLILGTNIGAGISVLLISFGLGKEAKRIAIGNLAFNIIGTILFIFPLIIFKNSVQAGLMLVSGNLERAIANFHTLFNVVVTIILLPLVSLLEKLTDFLIK